MTYNRPTAAEIDLDNFAHNIDQIREKVGNQKKILLAVKANAYGHGMVGISSFAENILKVDFLGVAIVGEGIELRQAGITLPVLIFGGLLDEDIPFLFKYQLTPSITDTTTAEKINQFGAKSGQKIKAHIKIDTGMGRVGIYHEDALNEIRYIYHLPNLDIEGIYTHFPSSDETDKTFTRQQIDRFKGILSDLKSDGIPIPITHCYNSGAIIDLDDTGFDMVRPGVMIYGLYPSREVDQDFELKQVMTLKSKIVFLKPVQPGRTISYGRTYSPDQSTVVATIPIGYGDGYNRQLSNRGQVLVRGIRVPVVGRVTMDQIMIDLGTHPDVDDIQLGEEVVVYGWQDDGFISINDTADQLNTISYEVTCWINSRVPRRFFYQHKIWTNQN